MSAVRVASSARSVRRAPVAGPRIPRVRWARTAPTVVLMYHRVERRTPDPLRLCVTPEHFAEQVAAIRTVAQIVAPHRIFEPGGSPRVAITFDDGYADNLHHALPVLAAHDAPACIFATAAYAPDAPEYWWDQLDHLFFDGAPAVPFVELDLAHGRVRFDVRNAAGRARTFSLVNVAFRDLPAEVRQGHIDSLHRQMGRTPVRCAGHARLQAEELAALAAGGLVEIGGHTETHAALPLVELPTGAAEIARNRRALAEITGHPPRLFAYPYGSYGRRDVRVVREAGYSLAYLARSGPISAITDPFAVPRLPMKDWTGDELLAELRPALGLG